MAMAKFWVWLSFSAAQFRLPAAARVYNVGDGWDEKHVNGHPRKETHQVITTDRPSDCPARIEVDLSFHALDHKTERRSLRTVSPAFDETMHRGLGSLDLRLPFDVAAGPSRYAAIKRFNNQVTLNRLFLGTAEGLLGQFISILWAQGRTRTRESRTTSHDLGGSSYRFPRLFPLAYRTQVPYPLATSSSRDLHEGEKKSSSGLRGTGPQVTRWCPLSRGANWYDTGRMETTRWR
ncbi:hypothetical protein QBC35DRAFT_480853 [Podospora australis]|uniref:Uncharacterized protein n=1 Tax=Podospora australis TaxID=1536484 RepID=A0AAN6X4E9_9PEZI|nr:hypothetical protein QBC35DRAFT_480853 [Podospora australis]